MKNKLIQILLLAITVGFFASCDEQKPPGLDLGDGNAITDSSYSTSVETKQLRNVLIEELTGVICSNCPKAADEIKNLETANPNRIISIGLHPPSNLFTEPITGKSHFDFRTEDADEIYNILGTGNFPSAALSRVVLTTGKYFDGNRGAWSSRITPMLLATTPVNIHLTSSYTADKNNCKVVAKVAFTEAVADDVSMTVYVIENDIKDYQVDSRLPGNGYNPDYKHSHVLRESVTSTVGSPLNFANKTAGAVLQKTINFEPMISGDNAWNLDNCRVVVFVHKTGSDKTVLHVQEVHLK